MRELFLVDSESSEDSLVLRTEEGEEFSLPITDELRSALTPAASKLEPPKLAPMPKPSHEEEEKQIRPAEIQNRIRAGASTAELAEEMHVDESRIEPFAYLKATLQAIANGHQQSRLDDLLPWNFKPSS